MVEQVYGEFREGENVDVGLVEGRKMEKVLCLFSIFLCQLIQYADIFKEWVTIKAKIPDLSIMARNF